jgi:hypothetical protein
MKNLNLLLISVLVVALYSMVDVSEASKPPPPDSSDPAAIPPDPGSNTSSLWRFGIGQVRRPLADYAPDGLAALRFGWYIDWHAAPPERLPAGLDYVPTLRIKQWKVQPNGDLVRVCPDCAYATPYTYTLSLDIQQIETLASTHPGLMWLVGNEIDSRDTGVSSQDEILPELYAQAYHEVHAIIKGADPSARIANGSLAGITPLRLKYLNRIWDTYQALYGEKMPVDVWNIHLYILPETSCTTYPFACWGAGIPPGFDDPSGMVYSPEDNGKASIAQEQIVTMRSWMRDHGEQAKPLIVSEYGVNMPEWIYPEVFSPEQIRDGYLYPLLDYMLYHTDPELGLPDDGFHLVQRWAAYSLDDDSTNARGGEELQNYNGNLFYSGLDRQPKRLSPLGQYYLRYVQSLPAEQSVPRLASHPSQHDSPENSIP